MKIPPKIVVGYNDDLKCFEFKDKIHIKNFGSGTAYLSVELVSNEDFNISMPDERENFIKKMVEGLDEELENLTKLYPSYSILINRFRSMIKEPPTLKDDVIEELRKLGDELSDTFENDEKFLDDFCRAYLNVYLKNLQLLTQIESFINYLNSIGKNKIILYNSTNMIKSSKTTGSLELLIYITDLNYNKYPVIKIPPIPISCETQFQIPIHSIFEFNNSVEGDK